ncbi:LPXTG cell wall anchor domain-containing protein, partial [Bacillus cereus]
GTGTSTGENPGTGTSTGENPGTGTNTSEKPGTNTNTNSKTPKASSVKEDKKAPRLLPETGGTPAWMISVAGGMMLFALGGMLLFRRRVK